MDVFNVGEQNVKLSEALVNILDITQKHLKSFQVVFNDSWLLAYWTSLVLTDSCWPITVYRCVLCFRVWMTYLLWLRMFVSVCLTVGKSKGRALCHPVSCNPEHSLPLSSSAVILSQERWRDEGEKTKRRDYSCIRTPAPMPALSPTGLLGSHVQKHHLCFSTVLQNTVMPAVWMGVWRVSTTASQRFPW